MFFFFSNHEIKYPRHLIPLRYLLCQEIQILGQSFFTRCNENIPWAPKLKQTDKFSMQFLLKNKLKKFFNTHNLNFVK